MIRITAVSIALVAAAVPVAGTEREAWARYLELLDGMATSAAIAGFRYFQCSIAEAVRLSKAGWQDEHWAPRSMRPADETAAKAAELCEAQLTGILAPDPSQRQTLRALMIEINTGLIERAWNGYADDILTCAQAEWPGCSLKPIHEWKGVRP